MTICEHEHCTGCGACLNACPRGCIHMEVQDGFYYPVIDEAKCVQCGSCQQVCPVRADHPFANGHAFYACKSLGDRADSSSGGVFSLLARAVLARGGTVYGVKLELPAAKAVFDRAETWEEVKPFLKSKYVQADTGHAYRQVKEDLAAGRTVLFSGLPCQVAGLKSYLRKPYDNLLCVDMVCYGVSSPMVFEKYIRALEAVRGSAVQSVDFRNKENGWTGKKFSMKIMFADGTCLHELCSKNTYYRLFFLRSNMRSSCGVCHFKNGARQSDLSLADFWGIETVLPALDDGGGTSLVMVHTDTGAAWWETILPQMQAAEVSAEDALAANPAAVYRAHMDKRRPKMLRAVEAADGADALRVMRRYDHNPLYLRVIHRLKRMAHIEWAYKR